MMDREDVGPIMSKLWLAARQNNLDKWKENFDLFLAHFDEQMADCVRMRKTLEEIRKTADEDDGPEAWWYFDMAGNGLALPDDEEKCPHIELDLQRRMCLRCKEEIVQTDEDF